jgi:opacity protein-like surface antigen
MGASATVVSYLFGPKIAFRHGKITPFIQTLFGGAYLSGNGGAESDSRVHAQGDVGGFGGGSSSQTAFAMALGGGVDYNLTEHFGVRLIQADYVMTKFEDGLDNRQDNARVSFGVVVRF